MKFGKQFSIVVLTAFVAQFFAPWWAVLIAGMIGAISIRSSYGVGFLSGFLGIAILWATQCYLMDAPQGFLIGNRIGGVLGLEAFGLIAVTAVFGGVFGGLGGLLGISLRGGKPKKRRKY